MKLVSIDIETTGLDPVHDQILEFGALVFDTEEDLTVQDVRADSFIRVINPGRISGDPVALAMHAKNGLLEEISKMESVIPIDAIWIDFSAFLVARFDRFSKYVFTGKNFAGFDLQFLKMNRFQVGKSYGHRFLDVGSLYFDPTIHSEIPSTNECMELCRQRNSNIIFRPQHRTINDCINVAHLVTEHYKFIKGK